MIWQAIVTNFGVWNEIKKLCYANWVAVKYTRADACKNQNVKQVFYGLFQKTCFGQEKLSYADIVAIGTQ